jgi:hypothetical protein
LRIDRANRMRPASLLRMRTIVPRREIRVPMECADEEGRTGLTTTESGTRADGAGTKRVFF